MTLNIKVDQAVQILKTRYSHLDEDRSEGQDYAQWDDDQGLHEPLFLWDWPEKHSSALLY